MRLSGFCSLCECRSLLAVVNCGFAFFLAQAYELGILRDKPLFEKRIRNAIAKLHLAMDEVGGPLHDFSTGCRDVLRTLLDPNPSTRATIVELQRNEWWVLRFRVMRLTACVGNPRYRCGLMLRFYFERLDLPRHLIGSPSQSLASSPNGSPNISATRPPAVPYSSLLPVDEAAAVSHGSSGKRNGGGGSIRKSKKTQRPSGRAGLTLAVRLVLVVLFVSLSGASICFLSRHNALLSLFLLLAVHVRFCREQSHSSADAAGWGETAATREQAKVLRRASSGPGRMSPTECVSKFSMI